MLYNAYLFCKVLLMLTWTAIVPAVPIDYCFETFNASNCNLKPVPVFHYHQKGSRCEIQMWRGCPTGNMFANEPLCSHYCIGRLWDGDVLDNNIELDVKPRDLCEVKLNTNDCGKPPITVYTYVEGTCVPAIWKGCKSYNKFLSDRSCFVTCVQNEAKWIQHLNDLNSKEMKGLDHVLSKIIKKTVPSDIITKLKFKPTIKPSKQPEKDNKISVVSDQQELSYESYGSVPEVEVARFGKELFL